MVTVQNNGNSVWFNINVSTNIQSSSEYLMNTIWYVRKLYTLQNRCYMSVNTTQLNVISSLAPRLSVGLCLWILNASLCNNMDQCLDLSIITVFSIKVSISRDGSLKGKLNRKFAFKFKSSQELICLLILKSLEYQCSLILVCSHRSVLPI